MNIIFISVTLLFLAIGVIALFLRDKDSSGKYKDLIIPMQGTKFKSNI
jgi:hypothetical protein